MLSSKDLGKTHKITSTNTNSTHEDLMLVDNNFMFLNSYDSRAEHAIPTKNTKTKYMRRNLHSSFGRTQQ